MTHASHVIAPKDEHSTAQSAENVTAPPADIGSPATALATDTAQETLLDDEALAALIYAHRRRLHKFVIRHIGPITEAEDLTAQAIAEATRLAHTFRGDSLPSTWLYGIALNLIRNHLSRSPERRFEFVGEESLREQVSHSPCPEALLDRQQTLDSIARAASELSPTMLAVFLLVDVHEATYEEASCQLAIPIGTVRSRLARARAALRTKLTRSGVSIPCPMA